MTIPTLIVDDEPLARRGIRQLLDDYEQFHVVGECRNGRDAVRAVRALRPALVFLDIQMPGMTGFDVVRDIGPDAMPAVVFVTAYDQFAAKAFETHALDYLVKPVTQQRFRATIERILARRRDREALALAERLHRLLAEQQAARGSITVPTSGGLVVVDMADIEWIEADDYYAVIHARGKRLLIRESLASFEERLDRTRFLRVHRSAIVALGKVQELRTTLGTGTILLLRDGTRVPVSRRRKEEVAAALRRR
ncbi:MAG TPA: LytTR family DNA-binding domain-containing protein [Gemmatimonadaceae bacterium]|nr:LytTR family DNA-binding domain-containing protein [Gemmatimonadaceae bacterium]